MDEDTFNAIHKRIKEAVENGDHDSAEKWSVILARLANIYR